MIKWIFNWYYAHAYPYSRRIIVWLQVYYIK